MDVLLDMKTYFLLGNYSQALAEGSKITSLTDELRLERDMLMFRCYIEEGKEEKILQTIKPNFPLELQGVRLLAAYRLGSEKDKVVSDLSTLLNEQGGGNNATFRHLAALIYYEHSDFPNALRCAAQNEDLTSRAVVVLAYLSMHRLDLAMKELESMCKQDEDAVPTQLATAWCGVRSGGEKCRDALYIYQEYVEKFGATPRLLLGQAVAYVGLGMWEEADESLKGILEQDGKNGDAIANLMIISQHRGAPNSYIERLREQLKKVAPHHTFLKRLSQLEESFDRNAARFTG